MAHGVDTDKQVAAGNFDIDKITADAVLGVKNVISQELYNWPGETPERHKCYNFFGTTVPDNTDYPDSIAPIGSTFKRIIITAGAVSGSALYLKTAAATWTIFGSVT